MADSGLSGVSGESSNSTPASKAVYTDNNGSRCLSSDEGISRGSSGRSGNSSGTPALYSRYGVPTKPNIKPPTYSGYLITEAAMQVIVSACTDRLFPKPFMKGLTYQEFDETVRQFRDAFSKKALDIRKKITATPLDAVRSDTSTPGGESLWSCTLPPTPADEMDRDAYRDITVNTPEEASSSGENRIYMMLPDKAVLVESEVSY